MIRPTDPLPTLVCPVCKGPGHPVYNGRCEDCYVDGILGEGFEAWSDEQLGGFFSLKPKRHMKIHKDELR